ncbi:hypothetical protein NDI56_08170 [Haloarcula sp. S1CR25-12]|uniref:Uncharacterized protein n=1 Tax=Haloarcula saliterrae TaxID=2950534 RepID=A0ABU2FAR6_9EURY|nr:hypothetical protein [Haloarcula sp. S1CR25-12]MDS0259364.1 hypothetical protein [Haloarcula sp. S1CR25-12]
MADPLRRTALLVMAALFITTPVWGPALDITGRDYQYQAALVTVDDNRIQVEGDHSELNGFDAIDCFEEPRHSRRCAVESRIVNGSSIQAPYPGARNGARSSRLDVREPYVAFADTGRVYERTTGWNDSAEAYVLGLERTNASRVFELYSQPVGQSARPVRRTVETGSAWADDSLSEPVLVSSSGRYYIVYVADTRSTLGEKPLTERLFELISFGIGILLFERARRGG